MKKIQSTYLLAFLLFSIRIFSQDVTLHISSMDSTENATLKELNLTHFSIRKNEIASKLEFIDNQLHLNGYFDLEKTMYQEKDTIVTITYKLNKPYSQVKILLNSPETKNKLERVLRKTMENDFLIIDTHKIPKLFDDLLALSEKEGEVFTNYRLTNIELKKSIAIAQLETIAFKPRTIDKVVIKGYENFPKSFLKYHLNLKKGELFNSNKLTEVSSLLKSIPFVEEIKKPQTLFTKDSTHLYLYINKKKSNKFDGLIGFNSDESSGDLVFNGYLDLYLENMFNYGSAINIVWRSNGNENQRFNLDVSTPYLFNSPISSQAQFQLYKQDSTFINLKTQFALTYAINHKNKISAKILNETSNNLLEDDTELIKDFNTTFYGLGYSYQTFSNIDLFPVKFFSALGAVTGNRVVANEKVNQTKLTFESFFNWSLNRRNYIFAKINSGYLISDDYLENELFRIGGQKTIRGFQEESIFASLYNISTLEYRYLTSESSFLYSITDYGILENDTAKDKILSLGLGYAFTTRIGLLNLSYTLAKPEDQNFDFSRGTLNLSYITTF